MYVTSYLGRLTHLFLGYGVGGGDGLQPFQLYLAHVPGVPLCGEDVLGVHDCGALLVEK